LFFAVIEHNYIDVAVVQQFANSVLRNANLAKQQAFNILYNLNRLGRYDVSDVFIALINNCSHADDSKNQSGTIGYLFSDDIICTHVLTYAPYTNARVARASIQLVAPYFHHEPAVIERIRAIVANHPDLEAFALDLLWQAFPDSYCKLTIVRTLIGIANHSPDSRANALQFIEAKAAQLDPGSGAAAGVVMGDLHVSEGSDRSTIDDTTKKMLKKVLGMMYAAIKMRSTNFDAILDRWLADYKDIKIENTKLRCALLG